jgi:hypothetical protein
MRGSVPVFSPIYVDCRYILFSIILAIDDSDTLMYDVMLRINVLYSVKCAFKKVTNCE